MLTYSITLSRYGGNQIQFTAPASEVGIVGHYKDGKPYQPDYGAVFESLPAKYRKAFTRAKTWWQIDGISGHSVPLTCILYSAKGANMGTLRAWPNWEA
jgi:hypothetical protein